MIIRPLRRLTIAALLSLCAFVAFAGLVTQSGPRHFSSSSSSSSGGFDSSNATFFDDFDYTMARTDSGATKTSAVTAAGWEGLRDAQTATYGGTRGYIYTVGVGDVPGGCNSFPTSSGRAVLFEAHPSDDPADGQTSYHLNRDNYPSDSWRQFRICVVDSSPMFSTFDDHNKFDYPKIVSGTAAAGEFGYLFLLGRLGWEHHNPVSTLPEASPLNQLYFALQCPSFSGDDGSCANTNDTEPVALVGLYHNLQRMAILPNTWYDITSHIDVSNANGTYDLWMRETGDPDWVHVASWAGGVTSGFTWTTPLDTRDDFLIMINPESVNTNVAEADDADSYTLIGDWCEATSGANLCMPISQAANDDEFDQRVAA